MSETQNPAKEVMLCGTSGQLIASTYTNTITVNGTDWLRTHADILDLISEYSTKMDRLNSYSKHTINILNLVRHALKTQELEDIDKVDTYIKNLLFNNKMEGLVNE